jgi:hypothetical protein
MHVVLLHPTHVQQCSPSTMVLGQPVALMAGPRPHTPNTLETTSSTITLPWHGTVNGIEMQHFTPRQPSSAKPTPVQQLQQQPAFNAKAKTASKAPLIVLGIPNRFFRPIQAARSPRYSTTKAHHTFVSRGGPRPTAMPGLLAQSRPQSCGKHMLHTPTFPPCAWPAVKHQKQLPLVQPHSHVAHKLPATHRRYYCQKPAGAHPLPRKRLFLDTPTHIVHLCRSTTQTLHVWQTCISRNGQSMNAAAAAHSAALSLHSISNIL